MAVYILPVKEQYATMLVEGKKTIEVRLQRFPGIRNLKPGDYLVIAATNMGRARVVGVVKVSKIEQKTLDEVTEDEAKACGFSSLEEMRKALSEMYQNVPQPLRLVLIHIEPYINLTRAPIPVARFSCKLPDGRVVAAEPYRIRSRILELVNAWEVLAKHLLDRALNILKLTATKPRVPPSIRTSLESAITELEDLKKVLECLG